MLVSIGASAEEPAAAGRQDRFTVGILAGSMFPQDRAYDTAAPEFGFDGRLQPGMALDALANQVGWHLIDYPETKAHAPFVALAAGLELGGLLHAWTLGAELHLPFDYLKFDVRFPSVLALVRVAL